MIESFDISRSPVISNGVPYGELVISCEVRETGEVKLVWKVVKA
jgi:hypothetical protein